MAMFPKATRSSFARLLAQAGVYAAPESGAGVLQRGAQLLPDVGRPARRAPPGRSHRGGGLPRAVASTGVQSG